MPVAAIVTTDFVHESHVQRTALGMEQLEPVIITHPLSTISTTEIESRAKEAASQVPRILVG